MQGFLKGQSRNREVTGTSNLLPGKERVRPNMTSPPSPRSWSVSALQGALDSSSIALGSNNEFFIAMRGQGDPVAWVHLISP